MMISIAGIPILLIHVSLVFVSRISTIKGHWRKEHALVQGFCHYGFRHDSLQRRLGNYRRLQLFVLDPILVL
jgi:hypothetical protein